MVNENQPLQLNASGVNFINPRKGSGSIKRIIRIIFSKIVFSLDHIQY